jgi:hypothetical protein
LVTSSNVTFRSAYGAATDLAAVDGKGSSSCLVLDGAGDVTVENVRFQNCRTERGGGVYVKGRSKRALFEGCEFVGNEAISDGGATSVRDNSSASFVRCEFRNNRAGTN